MTLHKEGKGTLISMGLVLLGLCTYTYFFATNVAIFCTVSTLSIVLYALVLNFFRYQARKHPEADNNLAVVCPADGRIVVIEEVDETEILGKRCLMVSIFMNVFDMHVNWIPVNGTVEHVSHNSGRFMAAHLPKASTDNERSAVVIRTPEGHQVMARQIAGAVARRIVTYSEVGQSVRINENMGFIKFGSRVDVYLPLGTEVCVEMGQKVEGNITLLARLPQA